MSDLVLYEKKNAVAWATLNRAKAANALNGEMVAQLTAVVKKVANDDEIRVLVLTGAGRGFSAGGDVKEMHRMTDKDFRKCIEAFQTLSGAMHALDKPILAAINGFALAGGFELALSCDLRIAAASAKFALPDAKIGLSPTSAMTYLLTRAIGTGRAFHLLLTGDTIDAVEAERLGLVTKVVVDAELIHTAERFANDIAALPPLGVASTKRQLHMAWESSFANTLVTEKEHEMVCFRSEEAQKAFVELLEKMSS